MIMMAKSRYYTIVVCCIFSSFCQESHSENTATVSFSQSTYMVEEDAGGVEITISLSNPVSEDVSVMVTSSDNSAIANVDYNFMPQIVIIPVGGTSTSIYAEIIDNVILESSKVFRLSLQSATPIGITFGDFPAADVIILDNDGATMGNDPHFFLPLLNGDHLCYSIQGQPDFMFSLIKDKYVQLNGQFVLPASDESNTIANVSTFLGNLGLLLRSPKTGKTLSVEVSAKDHSVKFDDEYITINDRPITLMVSIDDNITVSISAEEHKLRDESAWLSIKTDFGFGIRIKFYKKHLDMMITNIEILTSEADGLMGQFMKKEIEIDIQYNIMKIGGHKPIQVVKAPAWHFLGTDEECWYGKSTNNQGGGVIEGTYMDYMVEELLPSP